jgi:hypothetical protein
MNWPYSACLFAVLAPRLTPLIFSQVLTIRVINAANGSPLPRERASISLLYEGNEKAPAGYQSVLELETDSNGEARFKLPMPPPAHLSVRVRLTSEHWRCGCAALVSTQAIMKEGLVVPVARHTSGGSLHPVKAEAGQILFLARRLTFLERILFPLAKG